MAEDNTYYAVGSTTAPTEDKSNIDGEVNDCPAMTAMPNAVSRAGRLRLDDSVSVPIDAPVDRQARSVLEVYDSLGFQRDEKVRRFQNYLPTHVAREVWFEAIRRCEAQVDTVRDFHSCAHARKMAQQLGWGWRESDEPDCATVQQQSDDK